MFALELLIISLWNLRFGTLEIRNLSLETFVLGSFRSGTWAQKKSFGNFFLEIPLGNFSFGSLAWELWLGTFGLGSWAWGTGILRLGEPLGGSRGKPAGRGATTGLQDAVTVHQKTILCLRVSNDSSKFNELASGCLRW